ncbi:xanthine dehydrogenase family protein subunit M [Paractinoplanes ferrugineus]|uniref:Carbon-monoxide dehydrogenase medium subunit n=1 Tax=Paractinoplanes ferrugineus TaxID=113564 RepID=A0A919MJQ9_9ACTN|nr:FAD binding domain-containing protein [Actinoplanes ferrugineus]GIE10412.1 carbon-monoxide dehydrogenase medium subunit [Actinoplanes ferrugineus]
MEYLRATCRDDALAALADGNTSVLAGGQSLVLDLSKGDAEVRRVVDINQVAEFDLLTERDGVLRVAPLVRHRTFESVTVGGPLGELMRLVVRNIGHPPIRARGTMLGSLAYAHPAAEWPALAVALRARFELSGPDGCRTVPADRFYTGPFATVRRPEELLTEARLPTLPPGTGVGYAEDRSGPGIYPEAAAIVAVTMTDGLITAATIGLVNAGPRPVCARAAERSLLGTSFSDAAVNAAAEAAACIDADFGRIAPADRRRRERATWRLTRRALTQAREGC